MFYVSSRNGNLYGVTDTTDEVEEFYTAEQIYALIYKLRIIILGVTKDNILVQDFSPRKIAVVNVLEPLEKKIKKASFLSHPNDKDTLDIYKSICEYIKVKYQSVYNKDEIRYRYAKDGYSWFELVINKNGNLIIAEGSLDSAIPFGWLPSETNVFGTINSVNKWTVSGSKGYYKGIRKLIKSWNTIQKYLDSLIE